MRDWWVNQHQTYICGVGAGYTVSAQLLKGRKSDIFQLDLGLLAPKKTIPRLMPMVDRYVEEVTPTKKGESQER